MKTQTENTLFANEKRVSSFRHRIYEKKADKKKKTREKERDVREVRVREAKWRNQELPIRRGCDAPPQPPSTAAEIPPPTHHLRYSLFLCFSSLFLRSRVLFYYWPMLLQSQFFILFNSMIFPLLWTKLIVAGIRQVYYVAWTIGLPFGDNVIFWIVFMCICNGFVLLNYAFLWFLSPDL